MLYIASWLLTFCKHPCQPTKKRGTVLSSQQHKVCPWRLLLPPNKESSRLGSSLKARTYHLYETNTTGKNPGLVLLALCCVHKPHQDTGSAPSSQDKPWMPLCAQQVSSSTPRRPDLLTAFCSQTENTMGTTTEKSSCSSLTATQSFKADRASGLAKFSFDSTSSLLKPEAYNGKHSNILFPSRKAFIATEILNWIVKPRSIPTTWQGHT